MDTFGNVKQILPIGTFFKFKAVFIKLVEKFLFLLYSSRSYERSKSLY